MTTTVWDATPTRSTARLRLRPYTACDEDRAFFVDLFTDAAVMAHLGGALDADTAAGVFARVLDLTHRRAFWLWVVETADTGAPVGHAELKPNRELDALEIVYVLSPEHWGMGYAGETAAELVRTAALVAGGAPVVATVAPQNAASRAVLHRIGMRDRGETTSDGLAVYRLPDAQVARPGADDVSRR